VSGYEFADDARFRVDGLSWSVWIHDDSRQDHVKVTVLRAVLDNYAPAGGHAMVADLLNQRLTHDVRCVVNRAIDDGRGANGVLELDRRDLVAMLGELTR
jgi:hypothetical protein